jgi:hypothetical protein
MSFCLVDFPAIRYFYAAFAHRNQALRGNCPYCPGGVQKQSPYRIAVSA